jgi:hypothetical protein
MTFLFDFFAQLGSACAERNARLSKVLMKRILVILFDKMELTEALAREMAEQCTAAGNHQPP